MRLTGLVSDKADHVGGDAANADYQLIGRGVICMPPMYINICAYVGDGSLVDSHALVGSCAQIGKRVHFSAAAQIGGVIEPIGAMPVIIEDDVLVSGNTGIYEGAIVKERAVIAAGTVLTGSTPVYGRVHRRIIKPKPGQPLVIPAGSASAKVRSTRSKRSARASRSPASASARSKRRRCASCGIRAAAAD